MTVGAGTLTVCAPTVNDQRIVDGERQKFASEILPLADRDYVYIWADGVHFNVRLEDERLAALVMIGARPDGTKEWWRSRRSAGRWELAA